MAIDRESVRQAVAYLRAEADFNRSWTDGRRLPNSLLMPFSTTYIARRLELAEERDRWAIAIEALLPAETEEADG